MKFSRPQRLTAVFWCVQGLVSLTTARAQTPTTPQTPPVTQPPKPAPKPANPFETVPQVEQQPPATATPTPQKPPPFEAPKAAPATPARTSVDANTIAEIQFRGSRRVPQETLRAMIVSRVGEPYSEETAHRDFMALWNTGRFDDIKLESEESPQGLILRYIVTERARGAHHSLREHSLDHYL